MEEKCRVLRTVHDVCSVTGVSSLSPSELVGTGEGPRHKTYVARRFESSFISTEHWGPFIFL